MPLKAHVALASAVKELRSDTRFPAMRMLHFGGLLLETEALWWSDGVFFVSGQDLGLPPELGAAGYQNASRFLHCAANSRSWGSPGFVLHQPQLPAAWSGRCASPDAAPATSSHLVIDFPPSPHCMGVFIYLTICWAGH